MNMRGIPRYTLVWGASYTLGARYLSKNTVLLYYNIMGPPSCMRSVVDRNVVMRRIPVLLSSTK